MLPFGFSFHFIKKNHPFGYTTTILNLHSAEPPHVRACACENVEPQAHAFVVRFLKMAVSLGDFYGAGLSARPTAARSRELNSSIHSHTSLSYRPNESLTHRHDLQVSMTDLDANEHDLASSFLSDLDGTGGLRNFYFYAGF